MSERVKELLSNTLLFTLANLGSKVLVFLMIPLYTFILTTEEYGVSDLILTTVSLMYPILTICIADSVLRYCFVKGTDLKSIFTFGLKISVIGILISIIVTAGLGHLSLFNKVSTYIYFTPIMFALTALSRLLTSFSRGIGRVKVSALNGVINTVSIICFNLLFLLILKIGILGYLLSFIIADIISVIYMSYKCNILNYVSTSVDKVTAEGMCRFSIPLVPNTLSWWLIDSLNRYFISFYLGISAVGIFSATVRIPTILTVLSGIFAQAWLLSVLNDYGSEQSKRFIIAIHKRYFSLSIFFTSVLMIFSYPLASLLLSGSFADYWYLIPFLLIGVFLGAIAGFLGTIYSAEKKNNMQFLSTLLGAIISILGTYLFLSKGGIIIVAISISGGYFFVWLIRKISIQKYIDIEMNTWYAIFQIGLLFVESVVIMYGRYWCASLVVLIIIVLNYRVIQQIFLHLFLAISRKMK